MLKKETVKEFIRFLICGAAATAADFVVFGVVIFLISPEAFGYSLVKSLTADRTLIKTSSVLIGTAAGFTAGLIINYIISVFFVYRFTENAKSAKGVILFAALSLTGLFLNILLMKITFDLMGINHWLSKVIVTAIVFVYNYLSKRLLIFRP
jgi:putative flippase GtrA